MPEQSDDALHGAPASQAEGNESAKDARPVKILAVVDGAEHTGRVMKYLLGLCASLSLVDVVLLNIQPEPQDWRMRGYGWFKREEIHDRLINDLGKRIVTSAGRQLDGAGIPHRDRIELGDPTDTIVRCAREEGCDLIVLAEPEPGRLRRWLMRMSGLTIHSVASVVIHFTSAPVVIAR
jgi:nucleotide-binding universal stress UspA family protein